MTLAVAPAFPPLKARFPALSNTSFQSIVSVPTAVVVDVVKDDDDDEEDKASTLESIVGRRLSRLVVSGDISGKLDVVVGDVGDGAIVAAAVVVVVATEGDEDDNMVYAVDAAIKDPNNIFRR